MGGGPETQKGIEMNGRHCQAITKDGRACHAFALSGSAFCFMHDPDRVDQRAEAHRKDGQARQVQRRYGNLWDKKVSALKPKAGVLLPKAKHQLERKPAVHLQKPNPHRSATGKGPLPTTDDYLTEGYSPHARRGKEKLHPAQPQKKRLMIQPQKKEINDLPPQKRFTPRAVVLHVVIQRITGNEGAR